MISRPAPCTTRELIEELNHLLAEEVEASLRYLHLTVVLEPQEESVLAQLKEAFDETVEHAQMVGARVRRLGGVPQMDVQIKFEPGPITTDEALQQVLTFEEAALEGYQELYDRVSADGGADAELVEFLRTQVELETEHVEAFKQLVGE